MTKIEQIKSEKNSNLIKNLKNFKDEKNANIHQNQHFVL